MMRKTPQAQSKKTRPSNTPSFPSQKMATVTVPMKLLQLMFLSCHCQAGLSAPGCRYYFNWDGLGLSLI